MGSLALPGVGADAGTTEVSTTSGGDWQSELGRDLMGGSDPESTSTEVASGDGETPGGESPTSPEGPGSPAPDTPGGEGGSTAVVPYRLSEDGNTYLVPKADLPALTTARTYSTEVQKLFPTPQEAQSAYQDSVDWGKFQIDYAHGQGADFDGVIQYLAGKMHAEGGDIQTANQMWGQFNRLASAIPNYLKAANPAAYGQFAENFVQSIINEAYQQAIQSGQPADLEYAQRLDWGFTGAHKTIDQARQFQQPRPVDPREQQLSAREKGLSDTAWKSYSKASVEGPKWGNFNSEIDNILAPLKTNDRYDEADRTMIRKLVSDSLLASLDGDKDWASRHIAESKALESIYRQTFLSNGQLPANFDARIKAYSNDFMRRVRQYLPSIAAKYISSKTQKANGAANGRPAANGAAPGSPRPSNGAPAANGQPPSIFDQIGEDMRRGAASVRQ